MNAIEHDPSNPDLETFGKPGYSKGSAFWEVCRWLEANGINPSHVPMDPHASVVDGQITLIMKVRGANGGDVIAPNMNEVLTETRTFPLISEPSELVAKWLAPKCPNCGR